MRYFLQFCFSLALLALTSQTNAQLNEDGVIGSYQSILSRAGYGNEELEAAGIQPKLARKQSSDDFIIDAPELPSKWVEERPYQNGSNNNFLDTQDSIVDYGGSYSSPTWGNTVLPNRVGSGPIQLSGLAPQNTSISSTDCDTGACEPFEFLVPRRRN